MQRNLTYLSCVRRRNGFVNLNKKLINDIGNFLCKSYLSEKSVLVNNDKIDEKEVASYLSDFF